MNKYQELSNKIERAIGIIKSMKTNSPYTKEFLEKFRNHLEQLKIKVDNRTIGNSGYGRIGLSRWLSEYDFENDVIYKVIEDIEDYYKDNF
jgi:predicted DNA-binding protein